jgi:methionyl-tRNA formyltransferase
MRIVLFAATRRGRLFLERLAQLAPPGSELTVVSFREEPHEPPFLDEIRTVTERVSGRFHEARKADAPELREVWEVPVDLMFAVSWRYLIPPAVYRLARLGSFVFHDSLLPKYRGFAPTVWAIVSGERETGATLFEMTGRADEGDVVDQAAVPIGPDETIADVMERVTQAYLALLERNFAALAAGTAPRRPQDHAAATYCPRRRPGDNEINWQRPARQVYDLIRAITRPYPGAFTWLGDRRVTVWSAGGVEAAGAGVPGEVVRVDAGGVAVATGEGVVILSVVQVEGDAPRPAAEVLDRVGLVLGATSV